VRDHRKWPQLDQATYSSLGMFVETGNRNQLEFIRLPIYEEFKESFVSVKPRCKGTRIMRREPKGGPNCRTFLPRQTSLPFESFDMVRLQGFPSENAGTSAPVRPVSSDNTAANSSTPWNYVCDLLQHDLHLLAACRRCIEYHPTRLHKRWLSPSWPFLQDDAREKHTGIHIH